MPTYEYTCRDCGHTFDVVQSMWDEPLTMCPECGGSLRKVFAPPAISFKGSGFYATDHRKKAAASSEKSEDAPSDRKESKEAGSKEAGSKEAGSKEAGSKEAGSKEGGSKKERSKEPAGSDGSRPASGTSPSPRTGPAKEPAAS